MILITIYLQDRSSYGPCAVLLIGVFYGPQIYIKKKQKNKDLNSYSIQNFIGKSTCQRRDPKT